MQSTEDQLETRRRETRREMAWVCVGLVSFVTLLVFCALVFAPGRAHIAAAMSSASGILTTLLGVFATVIVAYFGASAAERVFKKEGQ